MNKIILKLLNQSGLELDYEEQNVEIQKFTTLLVHDFLSELVHDDTLGSARLVTIERLAKKWGVARKWF